MIETSNNFRCIDMVIDQAGSALTEKFIKELHFVLKTGTGDSRKDWFAVGEYKKLPNEVGGNDTTLPETVAGINLACDEELWRNCSIYSKIIANTMIL